MTKIKILHLSDLHYKDSNSIDQRIVIDACKADVSSLKTESSYIDIVLFSGDLVQAGKSPSVFAAPYNALIYPVLNSLGLGEDRFFICPGNHDVDREVVRRQGYVETGLTQTLNSRDAINSFIDQFIGIDLTKTPLPEPFVRMESFYQAVWIPRIKKEAIITPFSIIEKRDINGLKVAVCSFNSAWRCTGEADGVDRGHLIIGERVIDHAIYNTQDCTLRIGMFHHPFDWLLDEDRTAVESRLHSEFSAFFYGHVHAVMPSYLKSPLGGAVYSQAGCLYENRRYFNGYSIVDLDLGNQAVSIEAREYSDRIRAFTSATGAIPNGRVEFEYPFSSGATGDNLMALLATVRPSIKRLGDDHIRLTGDEGSHFELDKHFVPPPLTKPRRMSDYDKPEGDDAAPDEYTITDLLNSENNCILIGRPESGKTTLIHYMALKLVTEPFDVPRLPLRAKFSDFQKGRQPIWRAVRAYANEISDGKITSKTIEKVPLLIFVDEVVQGDDAQLAYLLSLVNDAPNVRWIFFANGYSHLVAVSSENEKKLEKFLTASINELSRTSIRRLSAQWLEAEVEGEATNRLFNRVMEHIARSGLPRSGYIVSLILWTIRSGFSGDLINEAVLLENIIDHMLGKMEYKGALRSEFDFTSKVAVLQELAIFLRSKPSSVSKNEITSTVISYLQRKGLRYDGGKIVDGLIRCGLLSEIDDQVEFRYGRFEEYFTAGYIRDNRGHFQAVVEAANWDGYAREMDIYTSRFRNDAFLLGKGKSKVDAVTPPAPRLDGEPLNKYLADGGDFARAANRLNKMKKKPMSARKIDELRDKADASVTRRRSALKRRKSGGEEQISNLRKFSDALEVYTRFIRNLEFADSADKRLHLDHCFDLWEQHAKLILTGLSDAFIEIREDIETDPKIKDDYRDDVVQISRDVENQVKCLIPAMVATAIYESLGTDKLSVLIKQIADNTNYSLLKRLLASFVLLDLDAAKAMEMMSSDSWHRSMSEDWVSSMVETRLHKYYYEQHLAGELRLKFERLVAAVETRLTGTKFQSDRMKDVVVQRLAKSSMVSAIKEKHKRT